MPLLETRVAVQLVKEGFYKCSSMSVEWGGGGGVIAQELVCDFRRSRDICEASESDTSLERGAQPRKREKRSWFQPRGPSEASTAATCKQLTSKYAEGSHAVLKVVQHNSTVLLEWLDKNVPHSTSPWHLESNQQLEVEFLYLYLSGISVHFHSKLHKHNSPKNIINKWQIKYYLGTQQHWKTFILSHFFWTEADKK